MVRLRKIDNDPTNRGSGSCRRQSLIVKARDILNPPAAKQTNRGRRPRCPSPAFRPARSEKALGRVVAYVNLIRRDTTGDTKPPLHPLPALRSEGENP